MLQVFESHAECLSPYLFTLYAFPHLEEIAVRVKQRLGKDAVPMVSRYEGLSYCVIGHFLEVFLHICTYLPLFRQIAETIQYTICIHVFFTDLFFTDLSSWTKMWWNEGTIGPGEFGPNCYRRKF